MLTPLVINLDRSDDRLAHMRRELGGIGVAFERIAAIDGSTLAADERDAFARGRRAAKPDGWLPGEIGCFLSHFEAWRRIANNEEPWGAVFEDDLRVSPDLARLLASADWIPDAADVVRLEANRSMRLAAASPIGAAPGRHLYRALSGTSGAGAYLLSKSAARRLVEAPPETHAPADIFLFKPRMSRVARELRRYQIVPAVCVQDGIREGQEGPFKSTIAAHPTFGRNYRERSHPILRLWPLRRMAVPFRA